MLSEIGSNFWINPNDVLEHNKKITPEIFGINGSDYVWLSTCRSAIAMAIRTIEERNPNVSKIAMVPSYTCETVIEPFMNAGYQIKTFSVEEQLIINGEMLQQEIENAGAGILIIHRYFGFDTTRNIEKSISNIKEQGIYVIEDRTQCLYSDIELLDADFYVGSIRKWHGTPDGAFCVCKEGLINNKPSVHDEILEKLKLDAGYSKYRYLFEGIGEKSDFLQQYSAAEDALDNQEEEYLISPFSYAMQVTLNTDELCERRRLNYLMLLNGLKGIKDIQIVYKELEEGIVPLYFTVIVKDRDKLQSMLRNKAIYAPIIWPKPKAISTNCEITNEMYEHLLCIPIDQRYDNDDMARAVDCVREYFGYEDETIETRWMRWEEIEPYKTQLIDLELELMIRYHYPEWEIPRSYPEDRVEALKNHLENGNTFFWGITKGDVLIGYYWAYTTLFIDRKRWVLRSLIVRPEFRKYGFGKRAIEEGLVKAKEIGCDEAVTEYVPWNDAAANSYKKAGYEISRIEVIKKI